ncbi:MAG TPA: LysR family transcriptional regulator, partial [Candidatus Lachnoclostridium stercorigallinarum]|nr:LysR family transcriptional regulator [Candidatus Lachnoclostridium stercorigallinarum]
MEFRQLQTFVIIAQEESFSRAAELLGYSQSAVTVQIRLLEEELQVRLFDRMGKRTVLTAQGRQMLEYANRILQEVNQARSAMIREAELLEPLHVGTLESLCFSKLPPVLGYFRTNYPKVAIKVTTASPKELITMMEKNQLDLIYFLDRPRYSNNWNKELEVREPIVFVASSDSPFAGRKGLELEEILDEPFFLTEKNENYRRELDQYLETKNRTLTPFLEITNTEFTIQMICRNRGISYLPYFAVHERVREGRLAVLDVADFQIAMYRQIFYHKNKWKTRE